MTYRLPLSFTLCLQPTEPDKVLLTSITPVLTAVIQLFQGPWRIFAFLQAAHPGLEIIQFKMVTVQARLLHIYILFNGNQAEPFQQP